MRIAVVIPSYKVSQFILGVISKIPEVVAKIYVVDDACPQGSGKLVQEKCTDPRVQVLFQTKNSGVGGAKSRGIQQAHRDGYEIVVKIDGDGQMDPRLLPKFVKPIFAGKADYTKGNRFHSPSNLRSMPSIRLVGNAALSFLSKATTGYWNIMDPTNGYFALHTALVPALELEKLAPRYFFENDMLFRLGLLRAVVVDVPMNAHYGEEVSNLSVSNAALTFPLKFLKRFLKRVFYQYFLRDFNLGSVFLLAGSFLCLAGITFGIRHWIISISSGQVASTGTVMLAALPTLLGFQMLIFSLLFDVLLTPRAPIHELHLELN